MGPQRFQRLLDFIICFANTEHYAGLGQNLRSNPFGVSEHVQRLLITRSGIPHHMGQSLDGFDILGKHLQAGVHDFGDGFLVAIKIRRQCLYCRCRIEGANRLDTGCVVSGATVGQVVAVHRSKDHVVQAHQFHRLSCIGRFFQIQPAFWVARVDGAKTAGAGTGRAHQHDGGGAVVPTFANVRAVRLFAYGCETVFVDCLLDRAITFTTTHRNT